MSGAVWPENLDAGVGVYPLTAFMAPFRLRGPEYSAAACSDHVPWVLFGGLDRVLYSASSGCSVCGRHSHHPVAGVGFIGRIKG